MKVKDVIAKISNGEKVEARHRLFDIDYYGRKDFHISYKFESSDGLTLADIIRILDDDIEIIEEDKKIEKLPHYDYSQIMKCKNKDKFVEKLLEKHDLRLNNYHEKINELIDEINNLKENK